MTKHTVAALLLFLSSLTLRASESAGSPEPGSTRPSALPLELSNGLRVLVKGPLRDALYSEVLLVVRAGLEISTNRAEVARISAEALTAGRRSPSDPPIRLELARLGVSVDSTVGREFAVFRFAVPTANTAQFLHLLALLLARETIPVEVWAAAIDRCRRAVQAEQADSWLRSNEELTGLIWKTGAGELSAAPPITTRTADRTILNGFWKKFYAPGDMVLSVWGSLKPNEVIPILQREFSYRAGEVGFTALPVPPEPSLKHRGATLCEQDSSAAPAALLIGTGATLSTDEAFYASQIAAHILGASYNSRLQRRLREQAQVVYTVEAADIPIGSDGVTLRIACQTDQLETTRNIILDELSRLLKEPVEQQELDYARAILRSRLKLDAGSVREQFYRESLRILSKRPARDPARADAVLAAFTPLTLLRALQSTLRSDEVSTFVISAHSESICEVTHASN